MPGRKEDTTPPALVLDVLERVHNVRNTSQASQAAEAKRPGVGGVPCLECDVCHRALSACRAIGWRRSATQAWDWCRVLVDGAALLLGWHAGLLGGVVGLQICALGLLGLGRTSVLLLPVHRLLLLLVLRVRVLVVDGWLARYVG
jgi:hypothetical protein